MDVDGSGQGRWGASGAALLCGRPDGPPLAAPPELPAALARLGTELTGRTQALGRRVDVDPFAVITERAACRGLRRAGDVSSGGATRLLRGSDAWIAVTLSRQSDIELVPAWVGSAPSGAAEAFEAFESVASALRSRPAADVVAAGIELGLPVGRIGEVPAGSDAVRVRHIGPARPVASLDGVVVVDLSALWAGPLCSRLLADGGATVIKVESTTRPDGARFGDRRFFDLLNAGKRSVAIDFTSAAGRQQLAALLRRADVVIEGSRPRALRALGIDAEELTRVGPRVWVSVTGYGRAPERELRVGFGDDAAAAGGLVVHDEHGPMFVGDALADPLTGMTAAAAVLEALAGDERVLLDVALAHCAAAVASPSPAAAVPAAAVGALAPPSSRGVAEDLGTSTIDVLGWIE